MRLGSWFERAVLVLGIAYFCFHSLPRAWRTVNTDFPNYYLAARVVHDGYDTARLYEWRWLQREKDHRGLDDPIVSLIPFTPISTLAMWPIAGLPLLAAKHVWILFTIALLAPIGWLLHSMTGLSYQRIVLVFALSIPLERNFQFGQFYVLILALVAAACWCSLRKFDVASGALVALAAACKLFPALLVVYFVQRRQWRALASAAVTGIVAAAVSVAVFGWNLHRTFLHEVIPWTIHGEGAPPYATSAASISTILHYLLLYEPEWNPHPWHNSPVIYALLQPALQMLLLAPAILLIRRGDQTRERKLLEWSALVTASLAVSTMPASYHFVLMAFPVCAVGAILLERRWYGWLAALAVAYLGIGFPLPNPSHPMGLGILLYVPRLPLMVAVLVGIYLLLWRDRGEEKIAWEWTQYAWLAAMAVSTVLSVRSTLRLEEAVRGEYAYRTPTRVQSLLQGDPESVDGATNFIGVVTLTGYHLMTESEKVWFDSSADDDLSLAAAPGQILVEKARSGHSAIADVRNPAQVVVGDGQQPIVSADGQDLAFVRTDHGRGQLMVQKGFRSKDAKEDALTPPAINVYEGTLLSPSEYAVAGVEAGRAPEIFLTDATHTNAPLALGEARYPALSPDGRWMAYSRLEHGMWNLWLRDEMTGSTRRAADVPCNQIEASWESDSKTLDYATDCGRSLWFTAVARRRVLP